MQNLFSTYSRDFISLFFPNSCLACRSAIYAEEEMICSTCKMALPTTNMHLQKENVLRNRLAEEGNLALVGSYLFFRRKGRVQRIIHALKYQNKPEVGELLGRWYAEDLIKDLSISENSIVCPIPLHPEKLYRRGYNQAAAFGQGIADALHVKQLEELLQRTRFTDSQTRKSREERYKNMEDVFQLHPDYRSQAFRKPIIIVDDVATTGATLLAAITAVKNLQPPSISVLTLSIAG